MYLLNVTDSFSAAHRLCGYKGACSNLHGHNWKVRVGIACEDLDDIGMALDYGIIKGILKDILDMFDHEYLNDLPFLNGSNPTSETLARLIYKEMEKGLKDYSAHIKEVEIYESERSSVIYSNA
ncbi:MAG: 6-carboxytetrahydropterin synthase QueD [Candidatus Cloacimonetes bacterium]|jgi:6-pyruvoyltetrahydropterin/6-carboxytetrahydropterin synthase|nr:6-carboxytetrahydropterin synthase QueD [Candidatus Cloacimonadota bacterium]MDY0298220.1 6-carboxytetrahydropterin synthase QueD [Candidatus Cloacimonadaceae bacterium]MCK9331783.1 6-carboxytetrahydropterin synthase QueD [Candidatus Cloacimonadota bacterium]MDD2210834.1 6-carboxytetrahydropterin synthase QueD [Candidatus Cloacimonadota bacterium]MDD3283125.1 6-carboxytetrahydropterin synthase QueD [Candidatus Cloacimonadota bacterium]